MPWAFLPLAGIPEPTRLVKGALFDIVMMAIIVCGFVAGNTFKYRNKYLAALLAWIFATMVFNWYYPLIRGIGYNATTIDSSLHVILAAMATVFVCSNFVGDDFIKIAKASCISAMLVSVFALFQVVGLDPMAHLAQYDKKELRRVAALLDHPDLLANYLAILLPFFFYLKGLKYVFGTVLCIAIILVCHSSLSLVAGVIGTLVFFGLKHQKQKKVLIGCLLFLLLFAAFCFGSKSFNKFHTGFTGRTYAWGEIIHRLNNPLFGNGLGIIKALRITVGTDYWMFAHNDYLEIFASIGAVGLFLFLLCLSHSIRNFSYKPENVLGFSYLASFVAFLIICFGSFPMEIPPLALAGLISFWAIERL